MLTGLGLALRLRREKQRFSLEALSARAGLTSAQLSAFELGLGDLDIVEFEILAATLNTSSADLMKTGDLLENESQSGPMQLPQRMKRLRQIANLDRQSSKMLAQLDRISQQDVQFAKKIAVNLAPRFRETVKANQRKIKAIQETHMERERFLVKSLEHQQMTSVVSFESRGTRR